MMVAHSIVVTGIDGEPDDSDDVDVRTDRDGETFVSVMFDFVIDNTGYDLDTPIQVFKGYDPEHPQDTARKYLEWKASELGLEDTNFVDQALSKVSGFANNYRPWYLLFKKNLTEGYHGPFSRDYASRQASNGNATRKNRSEKTGHVGTTTSTLSSSVDNSLSSVSNGSRKESKSRNNAQQSSQLPKANDKSKDTKAIIIGVILIVVAILLFSLLALCV